VVKEALEKYPRTVLSFNHGLKAVVWDVPKKRDFSPDIFSIN
jgi:hypothetical protein